MERKYIITYQVITGNYNVEGISFLEAVIITYQVITGNYNCHTCTDETGHNYNIPSNNRELQRVHQPGSFLSIITYQVITGNYNQAFNQG